MGAVAPGCRLLHPLGARELGGDPDRARGVGEPAPSRNEKVLKDKTLCPFPPSVPWGRRVWRGWREPAAGRDPGEGLQHPRWVSGCPRRSAVPRE